MSSLVAAVAMTVGLLAFTSGAASAEPRGHNNGFHNHYPPPPPSLVVNKGVVKYGVTVKATGRKYATKETVYVTVYFKAKGSKKVKVVKIATVRTDKNGKFVVNIKMSKPGTVLISATGKTSHKTAMAAVYVIDKKKGAGNWSIRPVAHTTTLASAEQSTTSGGAGLAAAGLGVLALAGSAALTRQTIRRRRGSAAA
ncbi:MAG TPA: hypothetical protein VFH03_27645 [Actinoplanes sp.]|nr:hypothetical protein [Actinoplanes sp.]